jgi:2-C-methyl-D-erythritol 4-phosphate cytidylyltransferase
MSVGVIIPAGGQGLRMGLSTPKQFLKIKGVRVIDRTLSVFNAHPLVDEIVVVLPEAQVKSERARLFRKFRKVTMVIAGGEERTHSVNNGFGAFSRPHFVVLVHDAVRPFVRSADISAVIRGVKRHDAVTLAVPVKDTIKIVDGARILGTPDRKTLWHTLTPQGFKGKILQNLLKYALAKKITGTDECMLAEKLGKDVRVIPGHYFNIKITTAEDLVFAEAIAAVK